MKKYFLALFLLVFLMAAAYGDFITNLDNYDTGMFEKANGWTNGSPFNNYWRSECVTFNGGIMTLTLDYEGGSPPYKSGEYRTRGFYSFGYYEVRMKVVKNPGIVTSFFTYTGPSDGNPWDEIDIEILGKDTTKMQTNYWTNGTGGKEVMVNLGFDASLDFHTYGFEWRSNYIKWYVDGKLVHTENGSKGAIPQTPQKIMMNLWPGIGVDGWLQPFNGKVPLRAQYDWFRYEQGGPGDNPTPTPNQSTPAPTPTPNNNGLLGDVNGDWSITIIDALMVAQYYVGLRPPNFNTALADVNKDNQITIIDALMIAQYYVGLISAF